MRPARRQRARGHHRFLIGVVVSCVLLGLVSCTGESPEAHRSGPPSPQAGPPAQVWVTTADGRSALSRRPAVSFSSRPANGLRVAVDDSRRYQHFFGVGTSMTGASAELIDGLREPDKAQVMAQLFSREHGIGLSLLRQPMGANDFSVGSYSYDDPPPGESDPSLENFSLGRDATHVLPLVREAARLNPSLAVVLSPWSAPGWMKTSGSLVGGSLSPDHVDEYADYLIRTVQAYDAAGVPVQGMTVQNEPSYSPPGYAGMTLSVDQQRDLIDNHLAPGLAAAGLDPHVWALDDNFDRWPEADALLSDPQTRANLYGVAFHCYRGGVSALKSLRDRHPDIPVAVSECSGGDWTSSFGDDLRWDAQTLLVNGIRNGASWLVKWNAVLDPSGGPTNGGCQDCRGLLSIDPASGVLDHAPAYYALGHVGRFVTPGAQVIASTTYGDGSIETVAFENPDGSHVLLALNSADVERSIRVTADDRSFGYSLPAGAVATFTW
jgi:glucosylceramidase